MNIKNFPTRFLKILLLFWTKLSKLPRAFHIYKFNFQNFWCIIIIILKHNKQWIIIKISKKILRLMDKNQRKNISQLHLNFYMTNTTKKWNDNKDITKSMVDVLKKRVNILRITVIFLIVLVPCWMLIKWNYQFVQLWCRFTSKQKKSSKSSFESFL